MTIALTDPGDSITFEMDWTSALPDDVTLSSVSHTVPSPLTKVDESTSSPSSFVEVSGAKHGGLYQIEASATLSSGETINRQFTLRCFNG